MDYPTKNGYSFDLVTSAMQKAIRRNLPAYAGWFALELYHSGYWKYVWKRLLTISAEDCGGVITQEIESLFKSFMFVNEGKKDLPKGRIFISKAVLLLCAQPKNRDADHLQNFIYDRKILSDESVREYIAQLTKEEKMKVPDFAYDCHTKAGKARGQTKDIFFETELEALRPRQPGLFDNLVS